ncbi:cation:proton antiporter [Nonomuraea sediminis]|uniref:cation:proton antiporter n=1 Tax=Nonomuraea sediminis TaxID=2835864 RepID=UPI001BDD3CC5|nr:cation:proton antiporter [Nonomuraea sediminis]
MFSIVIVVLASAIAPILAHLMRRVIRMPSVVLEILLGVLVGPVVLGWVVVDASVNLFSNFGLSMLMFMAGFEIEFDRIKGRPIRLATIGWFVSMAAGMLFGLAVAGFSLAAQLIGLAVTTTALGTILPMVRDAGALERPFGGRVLAIGSLGEFGPIIMLALITTEGAKLHTIMLMVVFAVIAVVAAVMAARPRHPLLAHLVTVTMDTSGQLAIRIVMLILMAMVWIADEFGLDVLLGAFSAGIVVRLALKSGPHVEERIIGIKLDAIAFGLLVPFFFVVSGVKLDITAMLANPRSLVLIPVFLVLFLVVRGVPTYLLHRRDPGLRRGEPRALALFASAALPLVVVITSVGVQERVLQPAQAAAMVTAGVFSVMIYPLVALSLYRRADQRWEDQPA